jgi:hypothetical protein
VRKIPREGKGARISFGMLIFKLLEVLLLSPFECFHVFACTHGYYERVFFFKKKTQKDRRAKEANGSRRAAWLLYN